jgi:hypothetical protein
MKNILLLLAFAGLMTGCQKETTLADVFTAHEETSAVNLMESAAGDRTLCTSGDCSWEIVAQGVSPEFSNAVVVVQRFTEGQLDCQQSFTFAPPICNTCWQAFPVGQGGKLRIFANVFTAGALDPHGKAYIYLRNPQTGQVRHFALPGGGNASVWIDQVACESIINQAVPVQMEEEPVAE